MKIRSEFHRDKVLNVILHSSATSKYLVVITVIDRVFKIIFNLVKFNTVKNHI